MSSSGYKAAIALIKSQQVWLPGQDHVSQNSGTDLGMRRQSDGALQAPPFTDNHWERENRCCFEGVVTGSFLSPVDAPTSMYTQTVLVGVSEEGGGEITKLEEESVGRTWGNTEDNEGVIIMFRCTHG